MGEPAGEEWKQTNTVLVGQIQKDTKSKQNFGIDGYPQALKEGATVETGRGDHELIRLRNKQRKIRKERKLRGYFIVPLVLVDTHAQFYPSVNFMKSSPVINPS